jgi:hypothetical protein
VIIDGIASSVSFSLLFCVLYLLVWNLDVERGVKNEKRLIKPAVVMDTNNGFVWVLSKMFHLCKDVNKPVRPTTRSVKLDPNSSSALYKPARYCRNQLDS